jgi:hypothetical protein
VRQLTRQAQAQEEEEGEEYPLIVTRPHRGKQQEFVPSRTQRVSTFSPGTRDEALAVERARRRAKAAAQELGLDVLEVVRTEYERASGKAAPPGRWGNDIDWLQKKISECGGNPHVTAPSPRRSSQVDMSLTLQSPTPDVSLKTEPVVLHQTSSIAVDVGHNRKIAQIDCWSRLLRISVARTVPATKGEGAEGDAGCTNGGGGILCFTLTYHLGSMGLG